MKEPKISSFNLKVYKVVEKIPAGKVMSYGQIAAAIGSPRAYRAVGTAMRFAPSFMELPCHRVLNKAGEMAPDYAFGGAEIQREKLEAEGVFFRMNGTVDMEASMYRND